MTVLAVVARMRRCGCPPSGRAQSDGNAVIGVWTVLTDRPVPPDEKRVARITASRARFFLLIGVLHLLSSPWPVSALAQSPGILDVGPVVHVTADDPTGVYVEPIIAVDPLDASRMAIAAIHLRDPHSAAWQDHQTIAVYASRDGGRSWSRRNLEKLPDGWFAGDPWLAWGARSNLYLAAIIGESLTESGALQFTALFRSRDGGWTWPDSPQHPFKPGTNQDHPEVVSLGSDLAIVGTIADGTAEGVYVARCTACSDRESRAWSSTERFVPGGPHINLGGAALLPDGSIVVTYYTMSPPRRYWAQRLSPAAGEPSLIAEDILPVGFPPVASEPGANRIVTVWVERTAAGWGIRSRSSNDGGRRWSPSVDIPVAKEGNLPMLPAIAASPGGYIVTTWQEQESGTDCSQLFAATSPPSTTNVPADFTTAVPISPVPSCSATAANGAAAHRFRLGGGDYIGLVPVGSDQFQVAWADARDGTFQIYTAGLRPRQPAEEEPFGEQTHEPPSGRP